MKIAVFSDIHGNYNALCRCVEYSLFKKINRFIFLGDYVGDLAYPQKTMNIIYELKNKYTCDFIKGNKEDYWIDYRKNNRKDWAENNSTTGTLLYTYKNLTNTNIDFFESLPISKKIEIDGMPHITICHGFPHKKNGKMNESKYTYETMKSDCNDLILCGHTHIQGTIKYGNKKLLNPGAIGVPLNSNGKAQFLILNAVGEQWEEEFISLKYNIDDTIKDIYESGLDRIAPYWAKVSIHLLKTGKVSHGSVLARAMDICKEENNRCNWPNISEMHWRKAVNEMIE